MNKQEFKARYRKWRANYKYCHISEEVRRVRQAPYYDMFKEIYENRFYSSKFTILRKKLADKRWSCMNEFFPPK